MSTNEKLKFYYREWFVWLMLICFAPIGIALLFSNDSLEYSDKVKFNISILFGVFFITYVVIETIFLV